jgi:hypothetical protein
MAKAQNGDQMKARKAPALKKGDIVTIRMRRLRVGTYKITVVRGARR